MKIAVIEDSESDRALLRRAFRGDESVELSEYSAPNEAICDICSASSVPDIVITDYNLGTESGIDVYDRLRAGRYDGPIVLMTGKGSEDVAVTALKKGFADYITKSPQSFSQLNQLVSHIVARVRAEEERLQTVRAHEETQRRLAEISESASVWFWEMGQRLEFTFMSGKALELTGVRTEDYIGRPLWEVDGLVGQADWAALVDTVERREPFRDFVYTVRNRAAEKRIISMSGRPFFRQEVFAGYRGIARDVTDIHTAELRVRTAEARLRAAVDSLDDAIILYDHNDRVILHNGRLVQFYGFLAERRDLTGIRCEDILREGVERGFYHREEVGNDPEKWIEAQLDRHHSPPETPAERFLADGRRLRITERRTPEGGIVSVISDVTRQRDAEEQLRQSQKLEAIGQLTGGVAHDFNNLLTVIVGNLNLMEESLRDRPELARMATIALGAADRGAKLTHHLLAFARKQALNPKVVDLNALTDGVFELIDRAIGEAYVVRLQRDGAPLPVELDAVQFENAALNLVINARDAMPGGGVITVRNERIPLPHRVEAVPDEIPPGEYVVFSVSDEGSGMSAETLRKCCDPFFTTKVVGEGSGLGLSMVYGFVQQSGGFVAINSVEGEGTTVSLHFPANPVGEAEPVPAEDYALGIDLESAEVLLVEDDEDVRAVVEMMLLDIGCSVRSVESGAAALAALEEGYRPNVLFTDFVLYGGINGGELARLARRIVPGLKVLFTSGYVANAETNHRDAPMEGEFLLKPFTAGELASALNSLLR